ncbi:Protein argonaute 2 [Acorus calamus]|uniref:Protein argonaute 2 n=1 Tax=Acorus calamus TaxID=4465 RepID=A0AAV9CY50_ACOCL|nr:Protein argonaute 2 [Acorus calamus]
MANRGGGNSRDSGGSSNRGGGGAQRTRPSAQGSPPVEAFQSMRISPSSPNPIRRPDGGGGGSTIRTIKLHVNHFGVSLNNNAADVVIFHYEIAIAVAPDTTERGKAFPVSKSDSLAVKRRLFMTNPTQFPSQSTAYDGDKNIFSTVPLPTGTFHVTTRQDYVVTVTLQAKLNPNEIASPNVSRNVLHALDVILREKPSAKLIVAGRGFYWADRGQDLRRGVVQALDGFIQGLRVTKQGLVVYVDHSAMAFRKKRPIIEVIQDTLRLRQLDENVTLSGKQRTQTEGALRGLPVTVNHRVTPQKFTVQGLGAHDSDGTRFTIDRPEGGSFSVREYFRSRYDREIRYGKLPCLDLGKNGRPNYVPMEFCDIAGGQKFPKQNLDKYEADKLRRIALANPIRRKDSILRTVRSDDGPCVGELLSQCGITISTSMTEVTGKVLQRPDLMLRHNKNDQPQNWAILDFSAPALDRKTFVHDLVSTLRQNGVHISPTPLFVTPSSMNVLSHPVRLSHVLRQVAEGAQRPQLLICAIKDRELRSDGYNILKLLCETELGIMTQCCVTEHANNCDSKKWDQYLTNFGLLINAKLGGSNAELFHGVPTLADRANERFMLIGADVNHPSPGSDKSSPSIAAVVGSINLPASTRYAARIRAQPHRTEQILEFGDMVRELVEHYNSLNKGRPDNIVIFRDGVADNQFEMVIDKELPDLREKLGYSPKITVIVAQKRHHTRLFPEDGNVPPGTVVDTVVVDQNKPNFYLCSHQGLIGMSKPTHYHVLLDDIGFGSGEVKRMIYHLCFTFARCTKPVSLVPPVNYADNAAYRGRVYHEAQMELSNWRVSNAGSSSSSPSSSLMSLASVSGGVSLPKVHKDIENSMFFL